ncbi:MAG: hypothetical protein ACI8ZM_003614 [Crocinitomix sp.]|jgi:hypothetical protein
MATVNVMIVFDTAGIVADPSSAGNYIYMVAEDAYVQAGNGGSELQMANVKINDTLIWRTVAINGDTTIKLTTMTGSLLNNVTGGTANDDGSYSAKASAAGTNIQYAFKFTIDDQDYTVYQWDPFVTIS